MRKTHYKVTLDVLIYSDEGADIVELIKESGFLLETEPAFRQVAEVHDITIEDIEVTDSR